MVVDRPSEPGVHNEEQEHEEHFSGKFILPFLTVYIKQGDGDNMFGYTHLGLWNFHFAPIQWYTGTLCTIALHNFSKTQQTKPLYKSMKKKEQLFIIYF